MADLESLKQRVLTYHANADLSLLETAYNFAAEAHQGQFRRSGEAFVEHPVAVAYVIAEMQLDPASVIAGLLHDTVEDTKVTLEQIEAKFGKEIASLVDGVTKLGKLSYASREEAHLEDLRKMFLAMARDLRVILIKLADRLHNMRTIAAQPQDRQIAKAQEVMEVYAPLAHRLGVSEIKWELEDLAFRVLHPDKYREVAQMVSRKRQEREQITQEVITDLQSKLDELKIRADISGRPKHFYSIYKKMHIQGRDITQIYDLIAIRVIVDEVKDCYGALGAIHSTWKPLPMRFKDYIATPKPNMYQSLHTTVIGPHGEPFEIQIRTWEMHRTSEYGIAAHWRYKEGKTDKEFDKKLQWLRSLLEWQTEVRDAREFVESVKADVFADQVFCFSPKGHIFDLPADATPLDFAFAVHSEVGYRCVGAKVNGKIVPLDSRLKTGDVIEVLTNKQSPGPSIDWLKIVKTAGAKNKIRQFFKRERRDENLARGKDMLEREIEKQGIAVHELMKDEWIEDVCRKSTVQSVEDLYVAIGIATLSPSTVVSRLREFYERERRAQQPPPPPQIETRDWAGYGRASNGIRVKGIGDVMVRFSRCCSPVPGDPVIGFVTRGRGVTVHRLDCPNMTDLAKDPERLIEVTWEEGYAAAHPVEIQITALDRAGLLADVVAIVAEARINMISTASRGHKNKLATIDLVLEVKQLTQLQFVLQKMRKVRDVMTVERVVKEIRHAVRGAQH